MADEMADNKEGMQEIPGHPLDLLSRLAILPPQQWTVRPCGDGAVAIGAWVDPLTQAVHKRAFRFTVYASERGEQWLKRPSPPRTTMEIEVSPEMVSAAWTVAEEELSRTEAMLPEHVVLIMLETALRIGGFTIRPPTDF